MADTSWRSWDVKKGHYSTDHGGGQPHDWCIIALDVNLDDWSVLGHYSTEHGDCCWPNEKTKWFRYLQDEAARLANEKGLVPEDTILSIMGDSFDGSVLFGAKE
jgi:hypothetical protein